MWSILGVAIVVVPRSPSFAGVGALAFIVGVGLVVRLGP